LVIKWLLVSVGGKCWYFIAFLQLNKVFEQDGLDLGIDQIKPSK